MSFSFDLISEGWIPCVMFDGQAVDLGLLDTLRRAPEIREIADPSPPVTASLHRLLLAILHRNFGPRNSREWRRMWQAGHWDTEALETYFDKWCERFDLFHHQRPFYQVAGMDLPPHANVWELAFDSAVGASDTLFDHALRADPTPVPAGTAARWVIAQQAFSRSGTFTKGPGDRSQSGGTMGPLRTAAVQLVVGDNLFETLMLNLVPYNPDNEEPFAVTGDTPDLPAWERDDLPADIARYPAGYLDYLTWQSKRVLLEPERDPHGRLVITRAMIAKGLKMPPDYSHLEQAEQMVGWKPDPNAKPNQPPGKPVRFTAGRDLWRDTMALLGILPERNYRPKVMDFLANVFNADPEQLHKLLRLHVLGLCSPPGASKAAVIEFWRHERLPLPAIYLADTNLREVLHACLHLSENTAAALRHALWLLAAELLAPGEERNADRDEVTVMMRAFPAEPLYWSTLEPEFNRLVADLAAQPDATQQAQARWRRLLRRTASMAYEHTAARFKADARALRAIVAARRSLGARLKKAFDDATEKEEQHA